uniref:Uncharacterized protein n=1 Tax=Photinus pyralis TaxID=7054 RepID=A0A1Y1MDI4_PHOPY
MIAFRRLFTSRTSPLCLFVVTSNRSYSTDVLNDVQRRMENLETDNKQMKAHIQDLEMMNKEFGVRISALELGQIAHVLRRDIIQKIFPKRNVPFKTITEVDKCASGASEVTMSEEELLLWNGFKYELVAAGYTVEQLDDNIKYLIDVRNKQAHPNVAFDRHNLIRDIQPVSKY